MPPLNLYARVRISLCILHTRPRVQRAPGFPCAAVCTENLSSDVVVVKSAKDGV